MAFSDLFKPNKFKQENAQLRAANAELYSTVTRLNAMLTPEMQNAAALKGYVDSLEAEKNARLHNIYELNQDISSLNFTKAGLEKQIQERQNELVILDEKIELESFALYEPRFAFTNAEEYKEELNKIRQTQKELIKTGKAVTNGENWTLNGSAAQGKKLVNEAKKLCLRSFNNECDMTVAAVKFNNYDRCESRIDKAFDTVNKLGAIMSVAITPAYKRAKIKELQLALEYQEKKQDEKEELRELRAQQREAAKLAKEIEEARKSSYKEQKHYERALSSLQKQLAGCTDEAQKSALIEKCSEVQAHLASIEEELKKIDYREANQRAGYVYIISNIGAFGENVYKIGMTRRLEPMDRIDELSDASVPFNFDVHALIFSDDAPALENALHHAFEDRKINLINQRREFFRVTLDEIKAVVKANFDETVDFIDQPEAAQYRETLKLKQVQQHTN